MNAEVAERDIFHRFSRNPRQPLRDAIPCERTNVWSQPHQLLSVDAEKSNKCEAALSDGFRRVSRDFSN
jgi:hypothetical protein